MNFDTLQIKFDRELPEELKLRVMTLAEEKLAHLADLGVESISWAAVSQHYVILRNERLDVVCACGEHFRDDPSMNTFARARNGGDAIQQWVAHYNEKMPSS